MNITDINKRHVLTLDLVNLSSPYDISAKARYFGITHYVYCFRYNHHDIIKYGESINKGNSAVERVCRQSDNLPGWNNRTLPMSTSGADMLKIWQKHYPNIHKDQVSVDIFDFTTYPHVNKKVIEHAEGKLIQSYMHTHNKQPIGNVKPYYIPTIPDPVTVENLFEFI